MMVEGDSELGELEEDSHEDPPGSRGDVDDLAEIAAAADPSALSDDDVEKEGTVESEDLEHTVGHVLERECPDRL
jgi:hypothetical protein